LNSYPILTGRDLGYVGGAEVEQVCLAKELVAQGYDVSFVTYRYGPNQVENVNGIEIIKTYESQKAGRTNVLLKYAHIWSSLKKARADLYFHEVGSTGVLPIFCYLHNKKFIYRIASDAVVLSQPLFGNCSLIREFADTLEIRRANLVIAQSEFQRRTLRERFRVESVIIKNGLVVHQVDHEEKADPPIILWVATISSVKRPHFFVKLAQSIPYARFEMVGGKTADDQLYKNIKDAARKLPNLTFRGFVPYHEVDKYFKRASIFVNTSSIEGFPNTFVQAWASYTPVVSLNVDPDKIIKNKKLGFYSGTFERLISDVVTLLENQKLRHKMGKNGRRYVEREHDIRKIVKKYIEVFDNVR